MGKLESYEPTKRTSKKSYSRIVIEKAIDSKFSKTRYESSGHDCWGNSESSSHEYVYVNGKPTDITSNCYIIHDDQEAFHIGLICYLPEYIQKHLDKNMEDKLKEGRYQQYLNLKKEFENDPVYIRDQKISKVVGE
jgi:hypothetical protein